MTFRNRDQSMGYWLNEPSILDPSLIEHAMRDLAAAGYGLVRIMLRNTNFTHRSPRVVEAVARAVAAASASGIRVALDCEPHADPVARDMGELFPEAMGSVLVSARAKIVNGRFRLQFRAPPTSAPMPTFDKVEAAFLLSPDGAVRKLEDIPFALRWELHAYADLADEHDFEPGRPRDMARVGRLTGALEAAPGSEILTYIRIADHRLVDFWAPGFRQYYDLLLDCYKDIPLDGVGWDEPAVGGAWTHYRYGAAFAKAFESTNGYPLAERLHLLDAPSLTPEAARVRLDYYRALNEGLFKAQKHLIEKARSLFGHDIFLGTHHTWHGEGSSDDYRAGAVDYFRLNDTMDAGYTDCCWWDIGSVSYAYALASSLGRLTPSREAECNTWHWKPTNAQVEYNVRLMTLLDINWFNIWYGLDSDCCLYPSHYTWETTVAAMRRHRDTQRRLGTALPVTDIAIWHGWESVCAINRQDIASAHKAFCINTARLLIERNIPFDFIDSRLLSTARIEPPAFVTALGRYRILVLPYAAVLPRTAWENCVAFARAGGKLLFTGPPPDLDTGGKPLGAEFADLLQMPPLSLAEYLAGIDSPLPAHRHPKIDVSYPLRGDPARILLSTENDPHAIRNPSGNVLYLTDLDPRLRLVHLLETLAAPEVECFSSSIQWRLYRQPGRSVLLCIAARHHLQMRGILRFMGHEIEIRSGTLAFIEEVEGRLEIDGENLSCRQILPPIPGGL